MKSLFVILIAVFALIFSPVVATGQTDETVATNPAVAQPLVREGTLAVALAQGLEVGSVTDEAQAESILSEAGITPKNGWIADYPVTPEIVGDLQYSVALAAESGKLQMNSEDAVSAFQDVVGKYGLSVAEGEPAEGSAVSQAPSYPDGSALDDYYYDTGPPLVTYYAPPPAYAYLYDWVPYPFWWYSYWFPGFFVLVDFDATIIVHGHHRHFSNHFFDRDRNRFARVAPERRFYRGAFAGNGKGFRGANRRGGRDVTGGMNAILRSRHGYSGEDKHVGSSYGGHPASGAYRQGTGRTFMSVPGRRGTSGQAPAQSSVRQGLENRIGRQNTMTGASPRITSPGAGSRSFEDRGTFGTSHSWQGGSLLGGFGGSGSYSRPSAGAAGGGATHWEGGRSFGGFRGSSGGRFRR
jgi:hypothetical protein